MFFPTDLKSIHERINSIDPKAYGVTRNYENGSLTYLSPYISRGVISTKQVFKHIKTLNLPDQDKEKLIQELAWRDYWQQVWLVKGSLIDQDLKSQQLRVNNREIPLSLMNANTGIKAIDKALKEFYKTGYLHNHMRMYIASLACNIGQVHWLNPAKWMYSNLLDGDWGSNALSWQWVAGTNANKKYFANQENINKFFAGSQKATFLDIGYEAFESLDIPKELDKTAPFDLVTDLPHSSIINIDETKPSCLYTYYNLDPYWRKNEEANRILILEPSHFKKYPINQNPLNFALELSKNVDKLQVFVGEFSELKTYLKNSQIVFKEHPFNEHFEGIKDERDWMFSVKGYFPSFFAFWKKCRKEIY